LILPVFLKKSAGEDSALVPNQGPPHIPFIQELLASASGKDKDGNPLLTAKDISAYSSKRRVDARASNADFSLSFFHKIFGSSKYVYFSFFFSSSAITYIRWS
jgi:hypothetical protein